MAVRRCPESVIGLGAKVSLSALDSLTQAWPTGRLGARATMLSASAAREGSSKPMILYIMKSVIHSVRVGLYT